MNENAKTLLLEYILSGETPDANTAQKQLYALLKQLLQANFMSMWSAIYSDHAADAVYTNVANMIGDDVAPIDHSNRTLPRLELEAKYSKYEKIKITAYDVCAQNSATPLTLLIFHDGSTRQSAEMNALLERSISKRYSDFAANARAALRAQIVACSVRSRDLSSFFFRCITEVLRDNFGTEAASIFYFDDSTGALILGASSGITIQRTHQVKRADVRYFRDSKSWTAKCFNANTPILEDSPSGEFLRPNTYGEDSSPIRSRIYIPLRVRGSSTELFEGQSITDPVGVMRLVNLNKIVHNQPITILQVHLLEYLAELMCVLARRYIKIMRVMHDQERATHGYSTDLLTIKLAARTALDWANKISDDSIPPSQAAALNSSDRPSKTATPSRRSIQELQNRLNDIIAVQDNMAHQLITVQRHSGSNYVSTLPTELERCLHPYKSVILRLLSAKKAISQFYNRPELRISSAGRDPFPAEFMQMPPLDITTGTLMLAVRNIAENAAKYCSPEDPPKLDITWDISANGVEEYVTFSFRDYGIGVSKDERWLLFREGFRGLQAKQEQLRGNGLGLAVSLRALKEEGGDMDYIEPTGPGTIFRVRVKKWRGT